ncbi:MULTISPECIES: tyrosine-type recombinase/integrase [unclassified Rhodococcus (in: high G+C Gram-positive bacteria)]|uniref:tyrosine-type recombinase/integrase n=1 Tax=unclassified Rhodococcus (in: high G+C Gram-positive bacteria) TaxID=192944 RepID=UPI00146AD3BC|nr:tyrosine-type recombinase/integrase [Rhodococcus sp. 105337]NME81113.1 tyrosine-type recombinase/integrase [Rhodococcus sp. 105337]
MTSRDDPGLIEWVSSYLETLQTAKRSPHTLKAYRLDLHAVCTHLGELRERPPADLTVGDISIRAMRSAFASFAAERQPASVRRAWSVWNNFCNFLVSEGVSEGNPMASITQPKKPQHTPKSFSPSAIHQLVETVTVEAQRPAESSREWPQRDLALIATLLLTGIRSDELIRLDVGSILGGAGTPVLRVLGKGAIEREIPLEDSWTAIVSSYLEERYARFPAPRRQVRGERDDPAVWERYPGTDPLFVGSDGQRITRGTLQYRVRRLYRRAGIESERKRGALAHALRHTFATSLADSGATMVELQQLLGHRSLQTVQIYTSATGDAVRHAAQHNPVYGLLGDSAPGPH